MEFVSQQTTRNQKTLNSSSSSRLVSKQSIDTTERNVRFQEEEQVPEVETLNTGQQQKQKTIIKTPYKINNTQEKLQLAESRKSPKPINNKTHRVVEIKKFDAGTSIISSEKQEYLNENSPRPVSNQSHVSVKTSNAAQTRWPQKVIKKKDIEAKPWYLWSFEETVELYLGDELRAEKYPKYNKSFVTKLKDPERDLKQQNQPTTPTGTAGSSKSRSNSIASATVKSPFSPQGSVTSRNSFSRKLTTPSSSKNNTPPHNNNSNSESIREQKIIQAVKTKKLKISELKKQIELANHQIEVITRTSQEEHNKIQQIISSTELSNENLDYLKLKISTLLNKTKLSIQELIHQNSDNQEAMMQLQSDIKTWEKDNHSKLFQRTNLAKMEKQIKIEQHKLRLKFKIRNNLIVFSQLMKKHRYNPSFLYQLQYYSNTQSSYSNNNNSNTNSPVRSSTMAFGKSLQQKMNQRKSVL
jgi:hypothetical protein